MRRFFLYLGFVAVLLSLAVWLGFDRLVDGVVRPWVVTRASGAMKAEVSLDRLEIGWGQLELAGLHITRPEEFSLKVDQVNIHYSFTGLLQKRLDLLTIRHPDVRWEGTAKSSQDTTPWPLKPPLRIASWSITEGQLLLPLGNELLKLHKLEAAGHLDDRYTVDASVLLGDDPGVPMALSGLGSWEGHPELIITSLHWSGTPLLDSPVTLAPGGNSVEITLTRPELDDAAAARLLAALKQQPPWPPELSWRITAPKLTLGINAGQLSVRLATAAGEVRREEQRWPWEGLDLRLSSSTEAWDMDGELDVAAQTRLELTGKWRDKRFLGHWHLAVPAPEGFCSALGYKTPEQLQWLDNLELSGELEATAKAAAIEQIRLTARLPDSGTLTANLSANWRDNTASVEMPDLSIVQGSDKLASATLSLRGQPAISVWQGSWSLRIPSALRLAKTLNRVIPADVPDLQEITLTGDLAMREGRLLLPRAGINGRLLGSGLQGKLAGQLSARQLATGWHLNLEKLAANGLEYISADGLAGVSGGYLKLAGDISLGDELGFVLRGEAGAGEALAGSWYGDLGELPLTLTLEGSRASSTGRLRLASGHFDLAGLVTASLQGALDGKQLEMTGDVFVPQLEGAFQRQLQQLAGGLLPAIKDLEMAGSLTAKITTAWDPQGWRVDSAVLPGKMTMAWGENIRLTGLTGELPLLLQRGTGTPPAGRPAAMMSWDEMKVGPATASGGRLSIKAAPNLWQLENPLRLSVGGGWLDLDSFTLSLAGEGPEVRASLKTTAIRMAEISRSLGLAEMGGELNAELPDIRFAAEEISTGGEAVAQVFDGTVRIRNMRVLKPFSSYPTYHADIDFSGIDLQQLTRAFAFGEMNGIADGSILDLRLFDKVPSAFRAVFETRESGTRNISVKALRNLNTLSQGGLSSALSQGIYRFIDFYRYRKIGIRCVLKNDLLHLKGTAREGNDSYLIYGGWLPPRIDVIVSSPTIAFQEMVKRIKRIERTGH